MLEDIARASEGGHPLRIHTDDGEVVVVNVLSYDEREVIYIPIDTSRPERYAVCDSTGFGLPLRAITRTQVLERKR